MSPEDAADRDWTRPESYRFWTGEIVRFNDLDALGHVNNNAIGVYFESGRVALVHELVRTLAAQGEDTAINTVIVRLAIDFRRELLYPATLRVGVRVLRLGRSSITLMGGVFDGDWCAATAEQVVVIVDPATRRPREIPPALRRALEAYA